MALHILTRSRQSQVGCLSALAGVRVRHDGHAAHVVLDRPGQYNALNHAMVSTLLSLVVELDEHPDVHVIVMSGAGDRGFSAGGDLVFLRNDALASGGRAMSYWRDLYELAHLISTCVTPIVSIMDGVTFGGGLGVAARAGVRVVTERSVLGMPETRIGFFPDTGGLHLLAGLPGEVGTYLGLCAQTVGPQDAVEVGLADVLVASDDLPALYDRLAVAPYPGAVAAFAQPAAPGCGLPGTAWVHDCFAGDDPARIVCRLLAHPDAEARAAGNLLAQRSPTAVTAALLGLRAAAHLGLGDDLELELRMADHLRRSHDFLEGIRARLVDKDRTPTWSPASFDGVDRATLAALL